MRQRPASRPVAVGQELSVDVESLADGPDALCRIDNYVLFVAGALPGERVRVRVLTAGKKYGRAELLAVERPSPDRVAARCPHFGECGGCHLQHLDYREQLRVKAERLAKTISHPLRAAPPRLPVLGMAAPTDPWGQRNKIALHLARRRTGVEAGLFKLRSREIEPIRECQVADERGTRLAFAAVEAIRAAKIEPWSPRDDEGVLRSVVVRTANATDDAHVTLVSRTRTVPNADRVARALVDAGATGVSINHNETLGPALLGRETETIRGPARIAEEIGGIRYLSSPGAFFQTSAWGAAYVVEAVRRYVDPPPDATIVDLYSGGGLFSLALAREAREVIGIEANRRAVEDARASAEANGIGNARFLVGPVEKRAGELVARRLRPFAVILDPPREGCDPAAIDAVARLSPRRVVYVSCEPASLGRDLAAFAGHGFGLVEVEPLDMFPQAFHVEAVALLEPTTGRRWGHIRGARRAER